MKQEKSDISLLLIILVLFSASIGLLHGFKISLVSASSGETKRPILSQQDMLDLIFPHLFSDNMKIAAEGIQQFDRDSQAKVVQHILHGEGLGLTDVQKIKLVGALAAQQEDSARKAEMFGLLSINFPNVPIFAFIIAEHPELIILMRKWAKKEHKKEVFNKWKNLSIIHALKMNEVPLLTDLYTNGIRLTPKEASAVLDRVVVEKKNIEFVPLLIHKFGASIRHSSDGKRTALIKAVETNNPDMVRVLIDEGANPRLKFDPIVGSALQVAAQNGLEEIEGILSGY